MSPVLEYEAPDAAAATAGLGRAWRAVAARFLIHGLAVSTWISRIASIKAALHLGDGIFGFSLFGSAVGSVIGIPICGWAVTRYGSRRACTLTSVGLCLALVLPAFASDAATLFAALTVFGAMAGADDVAMNSQAVAIEKRQRTPTMSRFHALFSVGGIAGAAAGGWLASRGMPVREQFMGMAAIFVAFSAMTAPMLA